MRNFLRRDALLAALAAPLAWLFGKPAQADVVYTFAKPKFIGRNYQLAPTTMDTTPGVQVWPPKPTIDVQFTMGRAQLWEDGLHSEQWPAIRVWIGEWGRTTKIETQADCLDAINMLADANQAWLQRKPDARTVRHNDQVWVAHLHDIHKHLIIMERKLWTADVVKKLEELQHAATS